MKLAIPALGVGAAYQLLRTSGVDPVRTGAIESAADAVAALPLSLIFITAPFLLITAGAAAAFAYSLEHWWGYRLERRRGSTETLVVSHGLLTRRSKDLEVRRMRGAELVETPLLRLARGARPNAVTTGLSRASSSPGQSQKALGPGMSREEAARVAAAALDHPDPPPFDRAVLRPHPKAARRRRVLRGSAAASAAALTAAAAVVALADPGNSATVTTTAGAVGTPVLAALAALLLTVPLASMAALDNYRALGNRLTPRYLVTRHGLLQRRTVALEREGIVGWNFRSTYFQRRTGLFTLTATTAAGSGAYSAPDMATTDAVDLADRAVPDLLTPFLEHQPASSLPG